MPTRTWGDPIGNLAPATGPMASGPYGSVQLTPDWQAMPPGGNGVPWARTPYGFSTALGGDLAGRTMSFNPNAYLGSSGPVGMANWLHNILSRTKPVGSPHYQAPVAPVPAPGALPGGALPGQTPMPGIPMAPHPQAPPAPWSTGLGLANPGSWTSGSLGK